jgi:chemotaxis protein CheD
MSQRPTPQASHPVRRVGVADYAVVGDDTVIRTSGLGSCLGIALFDPDAGISGLAHAMLPSANEGRGGDPAKFVDTGVRTMFAAMERSGARTDRTRAKLAGASRMFEFTHTPPVGSRNVEAAHAVLDHLGIAVVGEDVGGDKGRSLRFHGDSGALRIRTADGEEFVL